LFVYPATFFGLFPPFPKDERAFVAMSFDSRFDGRWKDVLTPAIRAVRVNDVPLEPHRVDLRAAGDSILTEILDGISRCRVFVADITAVAEVNGRAVRNANVMYEVGLAHAVRVAEEVILFRSDDQDLIFDFANVRVHRYDPDDSPETARQFVTDMISQCLREIDLRKALAVRQAAECLDYYSWMFLILAASGKPIRHKDRPWQVGAIAKLLDVGALRSEPVRLTAAALAATTKDRLVGLIGYRITALGSKIIEYGINQWGLSSLDIKGLFKTKK
jgi:hypothetical protein